MDTGSFVHESIKSYYWTKFSMDTTPEKILYETYGKLKQIWDTSLEVPLLKKAYDCLVNHSQWEYQNTLKGITKPFAEIEIDQNAIQNIENGYYGFLDYVNLQNSHVIDFKTGVYPAVSYEYRFQAHVYKILFEAKFGVKLKDFHFYYLFPNEWRKISYDNATQISAGKECDELLLRILNREFPKKPRLENSCRYCDYKYYCKVLERA